MLPVAGRTNRRMARPRNQHQTNVVGYDDDEEEERAAKDGGEGKMMESGET